MNTGSETRPSVARASAEAAEPVPRSPYQVMRSLVRWLAAGAYFFTVCPLLILLAVFVDPRRNDWPQRWMSRNILRLAGVRLEVRRAPGFDPGRTSFLVSNHVNLFDPFVLYSAVPQFIRGLELESHFRIPVYGWLMKRFGNVPVPEVRRPSDLKRMWRMTRAALDRGVSIVVFPEGGRTVTGRVGEFHDGVFRMALQFGTPIVPVSVVGSFAFNRKTSWMLRPGKVIVYLHDTIDTTDLERHDAAKLRDRVWAAVAGPVHAAIDAEAPAADSTSPGVR